MSQLETIERVNNTCVFSVFMMFVVTGSRACDWMLDGPDYRTTVSEDAPQNNGHHIHILQSI